MPSLIDTFQYQEYKEKINFYLEAFRGLYSDKIIDTLKYSNDIFYDKSVQHLSLLGYIILNDHNGEYHIDKKEKLQNYSFTVEIIPNDDGSLDIKVTAINLDKELG